MTTPPRCTAKAKSTGERCRNNPIKGTNVCRVHGGNAPQVRKKAQERLDEMADSTTAKIQRIVEDLYELYEGADPSDKLEIQHAIKGHWLAILNRTGHGPTEKREVSGEGGGAVELVFKGVDVTNYPQPQLEEDSDGDGE